MHVQNKMSGVVIDVAGWDVRVLHVIMSNAEIKCALSVFAETDDLGMTYQSAHMTTSKRPSIAVTSPSLSHLTTLRKNNLDYKFCDKRQQRNER